ncbi:5-dehydro-4-deoxy-D-glucuronate isomerase [Paenibacillus physcomitrellae]|uniref:4-deoxy-L-threo-5-hexosulose-uronate ketol-isomerase n=1 Tax=Paenibacillus physcomitrellae TaxID=1619311 RepID=A0ABQ1FM16_9BACL|nr:5-dehydro-4-deoxy-D-glucuronate isomerase [Paenibacillus physcomitrellae]GGA19733.1 4-deoxy-L-threo-5-hexosulose-uronate ketol-isomerase [Paenibacillus physcomitrellae]
MEIRYASHPNEVKQFDTERLRREFVIESLFVPDKLTLIYSHVDRFIVGGVVPVQSKVALEADPKEIGAETFLERREIGIINLGGQGKVSVDGTDYVLEPKDCLYVGLGAKQVWFASTDASSPAKFYLNSTPAHKSYPTAKTGQADAFNVHLGAIDNSNERTIYRYIHEKGIQSCQLVMGLTQLEKGNMWNTMPAHTHNRRSEVYLYFNLPEDGAVFHLMGEPRETRHVVMRNEQAVISPSWSIHSGVGTSNYIFIWGMAGENQVFEDMDAVDMKELK